MPPAPDRTTESGQSSALATSSDFETAGPELPEEEDGARMTFLEHLDELRKRLMVSLAALLVAFILVFAIPIPPTWSPPIRYIYDFIMRPLQEILPEGGTLIFTEPLEAFFLYFKVAALAALVLASPVILLQVWLFVAPGLYAHEKRFAIPFVLFGTIFFVAGALFSHYVVFPVAWSFFASFATDYMTFMPRIQPAFSLYVKMLLAFGIVFEMPTVVLILARVGVVTPRFLIRNIKYAILVIFIIAAIITPTPDPVGQTLMAAPMIVLYGVSIVIAWLFAKKES